MDDDGRCRFASEGAARIAGAPAEELAGQDLRARVPLLADPRADGGAVRGPRVGPCSFAGASTAGPGDPVRVPRHAGAGRVVLLYLRSTTDRHHAIAGRRDAERRLPARERGRGHRQLRARPSGLRHLGVGRMRAIYGIDPGGRDAGPAVGDERGDPPRRPRARRAGDRRRAAAGDGIYEAEWRIRRLSDGEPRVVRAAAQVVRDEHGRPTMLIGSIGDVTARVRVQEERDRLVAAVDQTSEMVLLLDKGGSITYANVAASSIVRRPVADLVNATLDRAPPAASRPAGRGASRRRRPGVGGHRGRHASGRLDGGARRHAVVAPSPRRRAPRLRARGTGRHPRTGDRGPRGRGPADGGRRPARRGDRPRPAEPADRHPWQRGPRRPRAAGGRRRGSTRRSPRSSVPSTRRRG